MLEKFFKTASAASAFGDPEWRELTNSSPLLRGVRVEQLVRLRVLSEGFLRRKDVQGAGGTALPPPSKLAVAVQAAICVSGLDLSWYHGWYSVILYPGEFRRRGKFEDEAGVVHEDRGVLTGEAWSHGPIILSWADVVEDLALATPGNNVVIHECAHKLDMLRGGVANGFPPLHTSMSSAAWTEAFEAGFERHCRQVEAGWDTWLDPYGAESPGEFFATAAELYFTAGDALAAEHPAVYQQLRAFFRADPLQRIPRPRRGLA
jgi:Mlc titration factor MtfA (ptsG expression regulator)